MSLQFYDTGWVGCPPSELCSIPTAFPGAYACPAGFCPCATDGTIGSAANEAACVTFCSGSAYAAFFGGVSGNCHCYTIVTGYADISGNPFAKCFALGQPRSPPNPGICD